MPLTEQQIAEFRQRGFIIVKGFFDREVMRRLEAWLEELAHKQPAPEEEAKYYETSPIHGRPVLVRMENALGPHNAEMTQLLTGGDTEACLTQLLGEAPLLFKDKVNYKPPGGRADKLHQDQAAGWNAYADFFVTLAIVVDPNRRETAALSFLQTGNYEKRLMGPEWKPLSDQDPPYSPAGDYMLVEADPGDVIFFDSYVPHGSPANTSDRQRRNHYITFNRRSDGDQRMRYYRDKWLNYPPNDQAHARSDRSYQV